MNNTQKLFILNQELKTLARVLISEMLFKMPHDIAVTTRIHVALAHKATDLFDGILQLQKLQLMEPAQALIRCLFETNLKFGCFVRLVEEKGYGDVCQLVMDSLIIMKHRDAVQQGFLDAENISFQELADSIKGSYSEDQIKKIQKHGFSMRSVEELANIENKKEFYNIMYRNFSRNVHANDLAEYFYHQGIMDVDEQTERRNLAAISFSHISFRQIITYMNEAYDLGCTKALKKIEKRYSALHKS
ncbi:MAG: DUF5677 domain-containing protein [Alphaproteobacteria bacterium]|nr:DUF5677 domain-containing protein [Alphaproteobacteria bacterium]